MYHIYILVHVDHIYTNLAESQAKSHAHWKHDFSDHKAVYALINSFHLKQSNSSWVLCQNGPKSKRPRFRTLGLVKMAPLLYMRIYSIMLPNKRNKSIARNYSYTKVCEHI